MSNKTEETAFPVTIKDALDNEITIKEKPEKIVSLSQVIQKLLLP